MKFLGIAHDIIISSAALIIDGEIKAASPEERFTRLKQDRRFPHNAINYCLQSQNLDIEDLDGIAIAWNPSRDLVSASNHGFSARRSRVEHFYSIPLNLDKFFKNPNSDKFSSNVFLNDLFQNCPNIIFTDHYESHLFSSLALSGFKECAYAIIDGRAETHTQKLGQINENLHNTEFIEQTYPNSLGLFYGAITQLLGYKPDGDEWKVMAMGAYANNDDKVSTEIFKEAIKVNNNGKIVVDMNLFGYANQWEKNLYNDELISKLGIEKRDNYELIISESRKYEIALSLQNRFEEIMIQILKILREKSDSENLILSGGCLMNSLFNGKIESLKLFKNHYIGPFPDDSGTSIGAAYSAFYNSLSKNIVNENFYQSKRAIQNYFGPDQNNNSIKNDLLKTKIPFQEINKENELISIAAHDLNEGKVVGWVQGKSEFGQRSLGNRSILLDPRLEKGKELINSAIKFREAYRPFAPAILKENFYDFFEGDPNNHFFMESVAKFKKNLPLKVPAVMNNDRTGRVQVVTSNSNELFYGLITKFYELTNCPMLLNTSFNLNGEPVVLNTIDAIKTFYSSGIDVLYIGNYRLCKRYNV